MSRFQATIPPRWHLHLITAVYHVPWDPPMMYPLGTLLSFGSFVVRLANPLSSCSNQFPPRTNNMHNSDALRFPF